MATFQSSFTINSLHRAAVANTRVANWQRSSHIITKARFLFCPFNFFFSSRILPVQHNNLLLCQSAVSTPLLFTLVYSLDHLDATAAIRICKRLTLIFISDQICSVLRLQPRRRLRLSDLQSQSWRAFKRTRPTPLRLRPLPRLARCRFPAHQTSSRLP